MIPDLRRTLLSGLAFWFAQYSTTPHSKCKHLSHSFDPRFCSPSYSMHCATQGRTGMGTPFVNAPYVYWKIGVHRNATPGTKKNIFSADFKSLRNLLTRWSCMAISCISASILSAYACSRSPLAGRALLCQRAMALFSFFLGPILLQR